MRIEFDIISQWVSAKARVLDLGCGDGRLLKKLSDKGCHTLGIEINPEKFNHCLQLGLNVIEQNMDEGLENFPDASFDVVILSQTLQALHHPDRVLEETLRIGKEAIVAFPNFGNWRARFYLGLKGKMPVSKFMPYNWYDTPNIHFCTIKDFEQLCRERNIKILDKAVTSDDKKLAGLSEAFPNIFASTAIYHISR